MWKETAILIFFIATLASCNGYNESSPPANAIQELNKKLEAAYLNHESWVNSPEDIAVKLFPATSYYSGPIRYVINKKSVSKSRCIVTILEEGPIDDETWGERRTLKLKVFQGKWNIVGYKYARKHRD